MSLDVYLLCECCGHDFYDSNTTAETRQTAQKDTP